jgi:hypothetical protein
MAQTRRIQTSVLDVAYEDGGPSDGQPVVLLHGYPLQSLSFMVRTMASLPVGSQRTISNILWARMSVGCCLMSGTILLKSHPLTLRRQ